MLRTIDIVMIGLLLGGAAFTFKVKYDSELAIERVAKLQQKIKAEQEAIDVLKADWSLLTDPKRLEMLAQRYKEQLAIEPIDPAAIGQLDEIPARPPKVMQRDGNDIADLITGDEAENEITTGSVKEGAGQ